MRTLEMQSSGCRLLAEASAGLIAGSLSTGADPRLELGSSWNSSAVKVSGSLSEALNPCGCLGIKSKGALSDFSVGMSVPPIALSDSPSVGSDCFNAALRACCSQASWSDVFSIWRCKFDS
jgi:hypothetical protein